MINCRFRNFDRRFVQPVAGERHTNFAFSKNLSKSCNISQDALIESITVAIFDGDVLNHVNKQVDACRFLWRWGSPKIALLVEMRCRLSYSGGYKFEYHFVSRWRGATKPKIGRASCRDRE